MRPEFQPAAGRRGLGGEQSARCFSAAPLIASLDMFRAAGIDELRAKSLRLTAYAEQTGARSACAQRCADHHAVRIPSSAVAS